MARTELTGKQIKDHSVDLTDDCTGTLPVGNGGTGSATLPLNNVLLGNGLGALQAVAPGTAGYVLTSDGSTWTAAPATGNVVSVNGQDGEVVLSAGDVGLGNVDNTSDENKPISLATLSALDGKEDIANKGEPNGYAELDSAGKVPILRLPSGVGVDSLVVVGDTIQLYSGSTPVGDPVSLLVSAVDGGAPDDVTVVHIDGGQL